VFVVPFGCVAVTVCQSLLPVDAMSPFEGEVVGSCNRFGRQADSETVVISVLEG
jgi:hypothetical protein